MKKNKQLKIKITNISYETDGQDVNLPTEIYTTPEEMNCDEGDDIEWFVDEHGAEYITSITGWLVNGFSFEIEK